MSKQIHAVYEGGVIRPLAPVTLPEGERLDVIVLTHDNAPQSSAQMLAHTASLAIEGTQDFLSGEDYDAVLYSPHKPV